MVKLYEVLEQLLYALRKFQSAREQPSVRKLRLSPANPASELCPELCRRAAKPHHVKQLPMERTTDLTAGRRGQPPQELAHNPKVVGSILPPQPTHSQPFLEVSIQPRPGAPRDQVRSGASRCGGVVLSQ